MMNRVILDGVDDRIRRDVMGHTLTTEEHGTSAVAVFRYVAVIVQSRPVFPKTTPQQYCKGLGYACGPQSYMHVRFD